VTSLLDMSTMLSAIKKTLVIYLFILPSPSPSSKHFIHVHSSKASSEEVWKTHCSLYFTDLHSKSSMCQVLFSNGCNFHVYIS